MSSKCDTVCFNKLKKSQMEKIYLTTETGKISQYCFKSPEFHQGSASVTKLFSNRPSSRSPGTAGRRSQRAEERSQKSWILVLVLLRTGFAILDKIQLVWDYFLMVIKG